MTEIPSAPSFLLRGHTRFVGPLFIMGAPRPIHERSLKLSSTIFWNENRIFLFNNLNLKIMLKRNVRIISYLFLI